MKNLQHVSFAVAVCLTMVFQGCARHEVKGAATKRNSDTQTTTPDAADGSAQNIGGSDESSSTQPDTQPEQDSFSQQNGLGDGIDPYGAGQAPYGAGQAPYGAGQAPYGAGQAPYGANQGQYGYPPGGAGGGGLDAGSIIGMFGSMLGPGGFLRNVFSGSNLGNAGSPARGVAGGCGS